MGFRRDSGGIQVGLRQDSGGNQGWESGRSQVEIKWDSCGNKAGLRWDSGLGIRPGGGNLAWWQTTFISASYHKL